MPTRCSSESGPQSAREDEAGVTADIVPINSIPVTAGYIDYYLSD
jgi:hypothetical protein